MCVVIFSCYRFIVLRVYHKLSKYDPVFSYVLFEGGFATLPYKFDKVVTALEVANHGELVAFAYEKDSK